MTVRVAVDFGTSSTCVAVSVENREPQVVLVDGNSPVMSSAVYADPDGELFVGKEAERQAAIDPARYEPHPKRRIDEGELLLGSTVVEVIDVVGAVLRRAVTEARRFADNARIDLLVLTHPADWGAVRSRVLRQAGHELADEVVLVPEPVAAAVFHAASNPVSDGSALAVLDVGGGTVDVSVVRRQSAGAGEAGDRVGGFGVLATKGDPNFGGADIDQLLLGHIGGVVSEEDPDAWRKLVEGRELADRRKRRVLAEDVRGAKETLSRHAYTDVPLPPPFPDAHVTRADLERLIVTPLGRMVDLTVATIVDAAMRADELGAIFLVGGSSRIPMIARLVHERLDVMPISLDQPETVVARGALRAVTRDPAHTGDLPTVHMAHPGPRRQQPPQQQQPRPAQPAPPQRPGVPPRPPQDRRPPGPPTSGGFPVRQAFPGPPGGQQPPRAPQQQPPAQPSQSSQPLPVGRTEAGRRKWLYIGLAIAVVVAVALVLIFVFDGDSDGQAEPGRRDAPTGQSTKGKLLAQYHYEFRVPAGWAQTGGDADAKRVLIQPDDGGEDTLIAVQEFPVNANTARDKLVRQLRDRVTAAGGSRFTDRDRYADTDVTSYHTISASQDVAWYVRFRGPVQISVGCQRANAEQRPFDDACAQVVRSMTITD